tara:strand:+ start:260 stop:973 length:714 start_codon:yes stop_codon:yes gene_type:complete
MNTNYKKTVIIFGGSGGIGLEVTKYLYDKGYNLVVTYNKNSSQVKNFLRNKSKSKNKLHLSKCNFINQQSIKNTIKFAFKKKGEVLYAINCVGIFNYDNLKNFNYKKISNIFKINAFSLIAINQAILQNKNSKKMIKIISIGSSSALDGFKDTYTYCGSKHALLGIIKSLNETIAKKKIINYCLNLGSIKNKMGRKVRGGEFKKFIQTKSVIKALEFLINIELPALPEEIFLKRLRS